MKVMSKEKINHPFVIFAMEENTFYPFFIFSYSCIVAKVLFLGQILKVFYVLRAPESEILIISE